MKRQWTRGEKLLWATPILVGVFAATVMYGPQLVRRAVGAPQIWETTRDNSIRSMALSANGEVLAAAGSMYVSNKGYEPGSGTIYLWDARTGKKLPPIAPVYTKDSQFKKITFGSDIWGLALSPDAKTYGCSRTVEWALYDTVTRKQLWSFPDFVQDAEFSADGRSIALSGSDFVWLVNAKDGAIQTQWKRDNANSSDVAMSPDGKWVANMTGFSETHLGANHAVEVHRASDGKLVHRLPSGRVIKTGNANSVAFSPDSKRLMVASSVGNWSVSDFSDYAPLRCFDVEKGQLAWQIKLPALGDAEGINASFYGAIFSPDGRTIAAYQGNPSRVLLLDSATGAIQSERKIGAGVVTNIYTPPALMFTPNGKRLFVRGKSAVLVMDLD